jgi:hypothetical protein
MENDWQKLGDVVKRIVDRVEITSGPPVQQADALLFVRMLRAVEPAPRGAVRIAPEPRHKGPQ